jgi:hypothetical protein
MLRFNSKDYYRPETRVKIYTFFALIVLTLFSLIEQANAWQNSRWRCTIDRPAILMDCGSCDPVEGCKFEEGWWACPTWKCETYWTTGDKWEQCSQYYWGINGLEIWPCQVETNIGAIHQASIELIMCASDCAQLMLMPTTPSTYYINWVIYFYDVMLCINCLTDPNDPCQWISGCNRTPNTTYYENIWKGTCIVAQYPD